MIKLFSSIIFFSLIITNFLCAETPQGIFSLPSNNHSSSSSSSSESHCRIIESADLIGYKQLVLADRNIRFSKLNLLDTQGVFDARFSANNGELIIKRSGNYDLTFFAYANDVVELKKNNQVIESTIGFPNGASILISNIHLKKGDILTLAHANPITMSTTGAGLKVILKNSNEETKQCNLIETANLSAFLQTIQPNKNIRFSKISLVDPEFIFDTRQVKKNGKLIVREEGTYNIDFFALASAMIEFRINGKVVRSAFGFPTSFSVSLTDLHLKKGDVLTLTNANPFTNTVTGASLNVSLATTKIAIGSTSGAQIFETTPATAELAFTGAVTFLPGTIIQFNSIQQLSPSNAFLYIAVDGVLNVFDVGTYTLTMTWCGSTVDVPEDVNFTVTDLATGNTIAIFDFGTVFGSMCLTLSIPNVQIETTALLQVTNTSSDQINLEPFDGNVTTFTVQAS